MRIKDLLKDWTGDIVDDMLLSVRDNIKAAMTDISLHMTTIINMQAERLRRKLVNTLLELLFLSIGIMIFVAGLLIFVSRYFPVEYVFLAAGVILIYLGLLFMWRR